MVYLAAAVVVVGLLCLLDLVLSLGVIRRLRRHTDHLNRLLLATAATAEGVPVGEVVGEFAATTTNGAPVSRDLLVGRTLIGFFSPGCGPCATQLPLFIEYARSMPARQVIAVVDVEQAGAAEYLDRLSDVAQVVTESHEGALRAAFRVPGFPMLYLVGSGGVVLASGFTMSSVDGAVAPEVVAA